MKLSTLAPKRHRFHCVFAGVAIASSQDVDAARAYWALATRRHWWQLVELVELAKMAGGSCGVLDTTTTAQVLA